MKSHQVFFVQAMVKVADKGREVYVDLQATSNQLQLLIDEIEAEGFSVENVIPMVAGVGCLPNAPSPALSVFKKVLWRASPPEASQAFGYSYTSGFMVLASKDLNKKIKEENP